MKLYLVRHAKAVSRDTPGIPSDEVRELTPAGIEKMQRHVRGLQKIGVTIDEIWSSPLVRARQTAELMHGAFAASREVVLVDQLAPGGDIESLCRRLAASADSKGIALVGHEPDLSQLAGRLLGGGLGAALWFKKGGVACIELGDGQPPLAGVLLWMLTPRILTALD